MSDFFLGIEVHDPSLWDRDRMLNVIDRMQGMGYNRLILHENDLLDSCTQLGFGENFGLFDLRLKKVQNRVHWLRDLIQRLDRFDAKLFLEVKEPSCHDYAFKLFPDLIDNEGRIDPTSKAWTELCRMKTEHILKDLPGLGGLIVNISSPESRVSLQDYLADTDQNIDLEAWLERMIDAFYQPIKSAGMDLYIRDFAYTKDIQKKTLKVIDGFEGKVGASIKITPHDYFPDYANNDVAFDVQAPKLIEFEAFGEHTGWGVIPNCRVQELIGRMGFTQSTGAKGLFVRISWEAITGPHAMETVSEVNVYALSYLARMMKSGDDLAAASPNNIVSEWLISRYALDDQTAEELSEILVQSAKVVAEAYWNGRVFPRHSRLPSNWKEGWHSMLTDGMGNRLLQDDGAFPFTDEDKDQLFKRKDGAVSLAKSLLKKFHAIEQTLPESLSSELSRGFALLVYYAQLFENATKATFLVAQDAEKNGSDITEYQSNLMKLSDQIEKFLNDNAEQTHSVGMLFDTRHIRDFADSLHEDGAAATRPQAAII